MPTGADRRFGRSPAVWWLAAAIICSAGSAMAAPKWRTYDHCEMEPSDANDGDSFHIIYRRPGYARRYFIRLYWVDCPESDDSIADRVTEQAAYWGISESEVLHLGKEAKKFTKDLLKDGFVVYSKLQDARGRSTKTRYYANVQVGDTYLAIALVEAGLARIRGFRVVHPDGPKVSSFDHELKEAELRAKQAKAGVWGVPRQTAAPDTAVPGVRSFAQDPTRFVRHEAPEAGVDESPAESDSADSTASSQDRSVTLKRDLPVYSLKDGRYVGKLNVGHEVTILYQESPGMLRIRFRAGADRVLEAQCRERDLQE